MRFFSHTAHHLGHIPKTAAWGAATVGTLGGGMILAALTSLTTPLTLVGFRLAIHLYEFVEHDMPDIIEGFAVSTGENFKKIFVEHDHCQQFKN